MEQPWTTIAGLVLLLGSGCAPGSSPDSDEPARRPSASQGTTDREGREAAESLEDALDPVLSEPATAFTAELSFGPDSGYRAEGVAIVDVGWTAKTTFLDEKGGFMLSKSTDGTTWMQMSGWPADEAHCWLAMSGRSVPIGIMAMVPDEPAYISVLAALSATGFSEGKWLLDAELELPAALSLLTVQVHDALEVTESALAKGRVPVEVKIAGGRVVRLSMHGPDVLEAVEEVGGEVPWMTRKALEEVDVALQYAAGDADIPISAPAPELLSGECAPDEDPRGA